MPDRPPNYWDEYRKQRMEDEVFAAWYGNISRELQGQILDAEQRGAGPTAADMIDDRFDELTEEERGEQDDGDPDGYWGELERREEKGEYDRDMQDDLDTAEAIYRSVVRSMLDRREKGT